MLRVYKHPQMVNLCSTYAGHPTLPYLPSIEQALAKLGLELPPTETTMRLGERSYHGDDVDDDDADEDANEKMVTATRRMAAALTSRMMAAGRMVSSASTAVMSAQSLPTLGSTGPERRRKKHTIPTLQEYSKEVAGGGTCVEEH